MVLDSVCLSVPMDQNSEAMGNMVKNLRDLEWKVKIQTDELLDKDKKIKALEELVETLQGSPGKRRSPRGSASLGALSMEKPSMELRPGWRSGQWSPERGSDTQACASWGPALARGGNRASLKPLLGVRGDSTSVGTEAQRQFLRDSRWDGPRQRWPGCFHAGPRNPPVFPDGAAAYKQQELETTCRKLQKQVAEMERFLADYGLLWVGEPPDHKDSEDSEGDWMTTMKFWKPGNTLAPPEVDFDRLLVCLKDLSELVAEGETQVVPVTGGARFRTLEPIPLKLYRNGLIMFDGPFRPFHEPATQRCLRDILDGFFPSELRRLYPKGVPFKVSDLRHQIYPENGLDSFPGEGRVVGQIHKIVDRTENADPRLTPEKFLKSLPKVMIRQGKVVDIRGPIRDTLQNYCSLSAPVPEILVETPALAAERERSQELPESPPPQLSLLRIKSEDGEKVFRLMMQPQDTIGDVYALLAKARNQDAGTFEIFSTFPPVVYNDHSVTLQDAGLVHNAMLLLRPPRGPLTTNPRPLPGP
ncbi:UBX domain-containing protein 11 isoform X2 [Sorex araneus]|uniref:UBX domain-containing protein 11 isoform X2 n=1 Tax=Sorex araneus TaxID=42254 RepID=UPI00243342E1|nr:UBX domain-containing protein 11 isoform X2 [Sorex araneus]